MPDAAHDITPFVAADYQAATKCDEATLQRLKTYEATLIDWNERMNLVSPSTVSDIWRRHFLDSAQLLRFVPGHARRIVDMGSGARFPGLVLAASLAGRDGLEVVLIESIEKKCAFLRAASAEMGLDGCVKVHRGRAEDINGLKADVVTARAMAPLSTLLRYAQKFTEKSTVCLFPKGRTAAEELTQAARSWRIEADLIPSRTDRSASVVLVKSFSFKGRRS